MMVEEIVQRRLSMASIPNAIRRGWDVFTQTRPLSVSLAMVFSVIGLLVLLGIEQASVAPMMLPLAGGFMLIGPTLLGGFFVIADRVEARQGATFSDITVGYLRCGREMLALSLVCTLLFLIWLTDAATLYGFMLGRTPATLLALTSPSESVRSFVLWSSIMGAVLAFVIFSISAFSVPLLYYRRAGLVQAVVLSVRAVCSNFPTSMLWAMILSGAVIGSILVLPLFLVTFPVFAFASHALYREAFPEV
jgi:uncharacterized membrane protein